METFIALKSGLVLHLVGIVTMVGFTFASYAAYHQLWVFLPGEKSNALIVLKATSRFQVLQMVGGALIVIGGMIMMIAYQGAIMHALWFKIKMVVLLAIIVNAFIIGRPAMNALKRLLAETSSNQAALGEIGKIKRKLNYFHTTQLTFFFVIFILTSFRFN